jgi:hypothetical protein
MLAGWVLTDEVRAVGEYGIDLDGAEDGVSLDGWKQMND